MLVGHCAVGLVMKGRDPNLSLGTLVFAAMLADFLWCIFMLAGIEQVQIRPGMGAANYVAASNIAMSHSLVMDTIWGAVFAGAYWRD